MTITTTTDCASLEISDQFITDRIADGATPGYTLELKVKHNCGDETVINLDETISDPYILLPDTIGDTVINDGVYDISLVKTVPDISIDTKQLCHFVDCNISCQINDLIMCDPDTNVLIYLKALENMNRCNDICCDDFCKIWKALKKELTDDDCGC